MALPDTKGLMAGIIDQKMRSDNPQIAAFEVLQNILQEFQDDLDDLHELGAYVANVDRPFHVRDVRRRGVFFLFEGVDDKDQRVVAVQHFSQMSLQLVKVRKLTTPATRIGFDFPTATSGPRDVD